jgi:hypothetical protein
MIRLHRVPDALALSIITRAWATVNKVHGGGEKPGGGGYGKPENREPMRKEGRTAARKRH